MDIQELEQTLHDCMTNDLIDLFRDILDNEYIKTLKMISNEGSSYPIIRYIEVGERLQELESMSIHDKTQELFDEQCWLVGLVGPLSES